MNFIKIVSYAICVAFVAFFAFGAHAEGIAITDQFYDLERLAAAIQNFAVGAVGIIVLMIILATEWAGRLLNSTRKEYEMIRDKVLDGKVIEQSEADFASACLRRETFMRITIIGGAVFLAVAL